MDDTNEIESLRDRLHAELDKLNMSIIAAEAALFDLNTGLRVGVSQYVDAYCTLLFDPDRGLLVRLGSNVIPLTNAPWKHRLDAVKHLRQLREQVLSYSRARVSSQLLMAVDAVEDVEKFVVETKGLVEKGA
jgi:hypothetical protein